MVSEALTQRVLAYQRPTRRLIVAPGDAGPNPVTKIGGIPWWPVGTERPACRYDHAMSFIAQIRLSDVPNLTNPDQALLSFHYCMQCAYEGRMSFGWKDKVRRGFDVRILQSADTTPGDGLEIVAEDVMSPHRVRFSVLSEIPTLSDLPPELGDHPPDDFFEYRPPDYDDFSPLPDDRIYPGLIHVHGSKLGGYPSWAQDPEWPSASDGRHMDFVGQLDYVLGENTAWAGGGYAYLFVGYQRGTPHEGELVILTT